MSCVTVPEDRVLAYMNGRQEQEFFLLLDAKDRPIRLDGEKVRMEPGADLDHGWTSSA